MFILVFCLEQYCGLLQYTHFRLPPPILAAMSKHQWHVCQQGLRRRATVQRQARIQGWTCSKDWSEKSQNTLQLSSVNIPHRLWPNKRLIGPNLSSTDSCVIATSASDFIIKLHVLSGYFVPKNMYLDNQNRFFRDDLIDVPAKKEALVATRHTNEWF